MPGWKNDMIELADFAFGRLRTRLVGLTDEEYFWEPAPDCWSVREHDDGRVRGDWATDLWPPPFTTIAWRITHIVANLNDPRYATHLGLEPGARPADDAPVNAADALDRLDAGYAATRGYLAAVTDDDLEVTLGPVAGPWADGDRGSFVLHMLDELIHHAAEVAVLRDLYRASRPPNPAVDALLAGDREALADAVATVPESLERARAERADLLLQATAQDRWSAVPLLIENGFPLALPDGNSALHHAAGKGHVETVASLLDAGADPEARDPIYRATPLGWAEWFTRVEAAEYLRSRAS